MALGIRKATLYAYVSRGLIASIARKGRRERQFRRADVARLASHQAQARQPKQVARATLDWGLPVLESSLTLIDDGLLYYRGKSFTEFLPGGKLEDVARLLWHDSSADFDIPPLSMSRHWQRQANALAGSSAMERTLPLFALGAREIPSAFSRRPDDANAGVHLLRLLAACVLGSAPGALPLHEQCRRSWRLDARGAELVRVALVACADHELNVSSFTARCIASTEADMGAAITGALAALSGPLHGGFTERIECLFDELQRAPSLQRGIAEYLRHNKNLPGFGHPLYPRGDPRAVAIMWRVSASRTLTRIIELAQQLTGHQASLDFALVAARRDLGLPRGSAFGLFAMGRTVGWIAHILEQRRQGGLIRPRAAYVGPGPSANVPVVEGRVIRFNQRPADPDAQ